MSQTSQARFGPVSSLISDRSAPAAALSLAVERDLKA